MSSLQPSDIAAVRIQRKIKMTPEGVSDPASCAWSEGKSRRDAFAIDVMDSGA